MAGKQGTRRKSQQKQNRRKRNNKLVKGPRAKNQSRATPGVISTEAGPNRSSPVKGRQTMAVVEVTRSLLRAQPEQVRALAATKPSSGGRLCRRRPPAAPRSRPPRRR